MLALIVSVSACNFPANDTPAPAPDFVIVTQDPNASATPTPFQAPTETPVSTSTPLIVPLQYVMTQTTDVNQFLLERNDKMGLGYPIRFTYSTPEQCANIPVTTVGASGYTFNGITVTIREDGALNFVDADGVQIISLGMLADKPCIIINTGGWWAVNK